MPPSAIAVVIDEELAAMRFEIAEEIGQGFTSHRIGPAQSEL